MQLGEDQGGKLGLADLSFRRTGKQQSPTVEYRELYSTPYSFLFSKLPTKLMGHNPFEPVLQSPGAAATEPTCPATEAARPRAHVPPQE